LFLRFYHETMAVLLGMNRCNLQDTCQVTIEARRVMIEFTLETHQAKKQAL